MSRRVFDVGLDMGRIKNGIHRRKDDKRTKSGTGPEINGDEPVNPERRLVPRMDRKISNPNVRNVEYQDAGPLPSEEESSGQAVITDDFPIPPSSPNENQITSDQEMPPFSSPHNELIGPLNFDLNPPAPRKTVSILDSLAERLFSEEHFRVILRDPSFFLRFTAFLNRYKPSYAPILVRYLEAQKAIKAVEYANALAESLKPVPGDESSKIPCAAATVDARFEQRLNRATDTLVNEALPAYVTFHLVKIVTESLVREITGTSMPFARELVGGLAEVFCLADPSLPDTPIIYASEEFYRTTQYGRDYVIGKNCRFLQGPKTSRKAVERIGNAIKSGLESSETILNYRRGGEPFMNLLMTAPLYDNRGNVRYFLGAQVDISGLIEDGRGLDSFARTINDRSDYGHNRTITDGRDAISNKTLRKLNEFGELLNIEESSMLERSHSRASSVNDGLKIEEGSTRANKRGRDFGPRQARRMLGNEEDEQPESWAVSTSGPSGKLPGLYQNYFLVRPHPSMRIIFVSPALRIPGLLQSAFLSHIGGPGHVRDGLSEAFESGESVTAKITWLPAGRDEGNDYSRPSSRGGGASEGGRTRYISCTPLLGSDDKVGVWMVVMVENEQVTGTLMSRTRPRTVERRGTEITNRASEYEKDNSDANARAIPYHKAAVDEQRSEPRASKALKERPTTAPSDNYTYTAPPSGTGKLDGGSGRLYADFLTRQQSHSKAQQGPSPYSHIANEGYNPQQYQRQVSTPGPGKVSSETESEKIDPDGLVDGLKSPAIIDGGGIGGEQE